MKIIILLYHCLICLVHAGITPPNYDFTLKTLEEFYPGKPIEVVKKSYPNFKTIEDSGDKKIYFFRLKRPNYILDVYTQVKKDTITNVYVRLPQYFLHDALLKELQTKWKKQDRFTRKDGSALYTWFNRDNFNIIYQGSCSITCFPMFIEIMTPDKTVQPFYLKFNEAVPTSERI
jgi:hypothetical protein